MSEPTPSLEDLWDILDREMTEIMRQVERLPQYDPKVEDLIARFFDTLDRRDQLGAKIGR